MLKESSFDIKELHFHVKVSHHTKGSHHVKESHIHPKESPLC